MCMPQSRMLGGPLLRWVVSFAVRSTCWLVAVPPHLISPFCTLHSYSYASLFPHTRYVCSCTPSPTFIPALVASLYIAYL